MTFPLDCECGKTNEVSSAKAGTEVLCRCGRRLVVPLLSQLRNGVRLPHIVEERLQNGAEGTQGEIPANSNAEGTCVICDMPTTASIVVTIDLRSPNQRSIIMRLALGAFRILQLLFNLIATPFRTLNSLLSEGRFDPLSDSREGDRLFVDIAVPVHERCAPELKSIKDPEDLRQIVLKIPEHVIFLVENTQAMIIHRES